MCVCVCVCVKKIEDVTMVIESVIRGMFVCVFVRARVCMYVRYSDICVCVCVCVYQTLYVHELFTRDTI